MIKCKSGVSIYLIASVLICLLLAGRGYMALADFTYFFVAGSDFVDASVTPVPVWVQEGQGYDGQFFFRYALDPINFNKTDLGVTVDLVPTACNGSCIRFSYGYFLLAEFRRLFLWF